MALTPGTRLGPYEITAQIGNNGFGSNPDAAGLYLGSLDGSPAVRLLADYTRALFVPLAEGRGNGHLLFRREDTLMAQPFDLETLTLSGEMFPVAEQVANTGADGFGAFSASSNGALAYRTGGAANRELVRLDRAGTRIAAATKPGAFGWRSSRPTRHRRG